MVEVTYYLDRREYHYERKAFEFIIVVFDLQNTNIFEAHSRESERQQSTDDKKDASKSEQENLIDGRILANDELDGPKSNEDDNEEAKENLRHGADADLPIEHLKHIESGGDVRVHSHLNPLQPEHDVDHMQLN